MKVDAKNKLNNLQDALSRIEKGSIIQNRFNTENSFLLDADPEYDSYLSDVLKATIFLLKNKILLIKDIFSKDISPNDSREYLLISRYFTAINNHIKSFILTDLIHSRIKDPLLYEYTDNLEHSAESLFSENDAWQSTLKGTENVLHSLKKYLIDGQGTEPNLSDQYNEDFSIFIDFIHEYGQSLKHRPVKEVDQAGDFPTDRTKFYITKRDGNYYYRDEYLKHNVGKGLHSQVLKITLNTIGSRDKISYKELLPYIRNGIPRLKNKTDSDLHSIIQKSLTSEVHGVNRVSKKQIRLVKDNGTPIFQNIKNIGLSFVNKI